ncbi:Zinc finger protein 513 [Eumeta japonica]|uniref:Zinc finger protein 513 n=1 Tax=Eumeta variegata TaxID=151549 RepID=A0A4C1YN99_EUMVA|nr:Zinc finger protein 513 [Eumeta japonica]
MLTMDIKTESDDIEPATIPALDMPYWHLQNDSMAESTLSFKEEKINFVLLQEGDIVMKTTDETNEMMIKQELDIGPTVLQTQITTFFLCPSNQVASDPRPGTSSCDGLALLPLCTVLSVSAPQSEVENEHYEQSPGVLTDTSSMKIVGGRDNHYQTVSEEQLYYRSHGEHKYDDTQKQEQCRHFIGSPTECNFRADVKKDNASESNLEKNCILEKPNLISHICTHMDSKQSGEGDLNIHMLNHMVENPYKRKQCEFSSFRPCNLKVHKRTHTGKKSFKCEQCEYRTTQLRILKRHMGTRTGGTPFKYKQCKYSTSGTHELKIHMSTHTGEKPFKCEH